MKKKNLFWGIAFILIAACILISKIYFPGINLFKAVLAIALAMLALESIVHLNFPGILFPAAFICILFDEALHITDLTPWPVLGIALFGSIGLTMIFPSKHHHYHYDHHNQSFSDTQTNEYGNTINSSVTFNSTIKYINSDCFEKANFETSFGTLTAYFDQAKLSNNVADVKVDCSFGTIVLYFPRDWNIHINVDSSFGSVEEKGAKQYNPEAPQVNIIGDVSFGSIEIHYI